MNGNPTLSAHSPDGGPADPGESCGVIEGDPGRLGRLNRIGRHGSRIVLGEHDIENQTLATAITIYADVVPPEREVLADRRHRLAPPPWRIYVALSEEIDRWLTLRPREVAPLVVNAVRPSLVEWSSLWPVSPDDSITFDIERDGAGCAVTLRWWTASPPDERSVALVRHRLNNAIGGELRDFVDTCG